MARPDVAEEPGVLPKEELARAIHCAECSHLITSPKYATSVDGGQERTFRNPAGYSFHVLCFSQADGCVVKGSPSTADSWFRDTAWAFAFCQQCGQHLGWHYTRLQGAHPFFGLIATRLTR